MTLIHQITAQHHIAGRNKACGQKEPNLILVRFCCMTISWEELFVMHVHTKAIGVLHSYLHSRSNQCSLIKLCSGEFGLIKPFLQLVFLSNTSAKKRWYHVSNMGLCSFSLQCKLFTIQWKWVIFYIILFAHKSKHSLVKKCLGVKFCLSGNRPLFHSE